jgi:long-chain acyl-CoA synthetase
MPIDKRWLKHYDSGVAASLDYPSHPVHDFLTRTVAKTPNASATLVSAHLPVVGRQHSELTYQQINEQSDALAAALVDMGVKKGDRVAIVLANSVQFVITYFAILKAGGIVCATNPTYPGPKMAAQLKDCGATVVIVMSLFYNLIKEVQSQTDIKQVIVTNYKEYLPPLAKFLFTLAKEKKDGHRITKADSDHDFQDILTRYAGKKSTVQVTSSDYALFQYTGGTTGTSKAAMATHAAIVANSLQIKAWLNWSSPEQIVLMASIPLFHVYGLVSVLNFTVSVGGKMLLVPNPRDTKEVLETIHTFKPSIYNGVPAMYNAINVNEDVKAGKYDIRSVKYCISGSAPLPPATKRQFEAITGGTLVEGFGMSETPTAAIVNPLRGKNPEGSIGLPISDVDIKIISLEDGVTELGIGDVGELCVAGPQLFSGYWNNAADTANTLRKDSSGKAWVHTGDIARVDEDGFVYIVDRKKDMAIIGGFNVYPNNVEKVLAEHPAVQEAAVAAIKHPDKPGQEALKAWVMIKPGSSVTSEELIKFAEGRLARYEVPTRIEFAQDFPRTTVGKVLRRELAQSELAKEKKSS